LLDPGTRLGPYTIVELVAVGGDGRGLSRGGPENGIQYAVTEFLEGETLRARISRGRMSTREALDLMLDIADGVAAEEAELLAAELGLPSTRMPADPPYPNMLRYLAVFDHERISTGTGASR
jgi:hypothetical protein